MDSPEKSFGSKTHIFRCDWQNTGIVGEFQPPLRVPSGLYGKFDGHISSPVMIINWYLVRPLQWKTFLSCLVWNTRRSDPAFIRAWRFMFYFISQATKLTHLVSNWLIAAGWDCHLKFHNFQASNQTESDCFPASIGPEDLHVCIGKYPLLFHPNVWHFPVENETSC